METRLKAIEGKQK